MNRNKLRPSLSLLLQGAKKHSWRFVRRSGVGHVFWWQIFVLHKSLLRSLRRLSPNLCKWMEDHKYNFSSAAFQFVHENTRNLLFWCLCEVENSESATETVSGYRNLMASRGLVISVVQKSIVCIYSLCSFFFSAGLLVMSSGKLASPTKYLVWRGIAQ